jgi:branched-chain amino acid aminotransferase
MLTVEWDAQHGWHQPKIQPYGPLVLDPSCSVFHYSMEVCNLTMIEVIRQCP